MFSHLGRIFTRRKSRTRGSKGSSKSLDAIQREVKRNEQRRRELRRKVFIAHAQMQGLQHKAGLIAKRKGRNGLSMSPRLLAKHGIQLDPKKDA